jgi:hypothetical protein
MNNKKNTKATAKEVLTPIKETVETPIVETPAKPKRKRYHKPKTVKPTVEVVSVEDVAPAEISVVTSIPVKKVGWFEHLFPKFTSWLRK